MWPNRKLYSPQVKQECPNTWKETLNVSMAPFPPSTATLSMCTVSVESHLSLLFREIPIVFKTRSSLTVWLKKRIYTQNEKYLNSTFDLADLKSHWGHLQEKQNVRNAKSRVRLHHAGPPVAQFQQGGRCLVIHFVKSSKYDVITAAQGQQRHLDRTGASLGATDPLSQFSYLVQSKCLDYRVNMHITSTQKHCQSSTTVPRGNPSHLC